MNHRALALLLASSVLAACARPAPTPAPTPAAEPATAAPASPACCSATAADAPASADTSRATAHADSTADTVRVAPSEVKQQAVAVFGDSVAPASPADTAEADAEPNWDIDVRSYEGYERVTHYVALFAGDAKERFAERLERGTRYEPMIRAKLRAAWLPEDMTYLALVESGYNPNAYSRAAAVGLWQLMTSTATGAGLRVDWWVDERRDPVRSTDAAIKFLRYLKAQFGSLYLAAAAYNGGPGRVARGLTRYADDLEGTTGDDLFFALAEKDYLRAETRDYVPQLIAAAIVAKEPAKYGLRITPQPPFVYDSVRVPPSTPLAAVARASGATLSEVLDLNPQLLRGVTPPKAAFYVRVPTGKAADFDSAFAALDSMTRRAYRRVVTKRGETLASLTRREGLSARQLQWYNRRLEVSRKTGRLAPGQVILVPSAAVVAAARDVPDPAIERYATSRRLVVYVVRRGDALDRIARRYHTTTAALMRLNGLRKSMIFPGQVLVVRGGARGAAGKAAAGRARRACGTACRRGGG